jgi:hypothetical protein
MNKPLALETASHSIGGPLGEHGGGLAYKELSGKGEILFLKGDV